MMNLFGQARKLRGDDKPEAVEGEPDDTSVLSVRNPLSPSFPFVFIANIQRCFGTVANLFPFSTSYPYLPRCSRVLSAAMLTLMAGMIHRAASFRT